VNGRLAVRGTSSAIKVETVNGSVRLARGT
jgi:DUF4097 and DUF4098 domain-containing protein YvlB